ncbi:hypothetical protein KALB_8478 [Kutzneria albida DSM 43870]|uniref:Uncharacterized protein n=1 Tax=Kutzneria albida DSM 43870 TaxID=1449976 RepID=W5WUK6_9PSEU|nr:hypothetical protein KALB_8478 [Kutzneria albida DSM 43870]
MGAVDCADVAVLEGARVVEGREVAVVLTGCGLLGPGFAGGSCCAGWVPSASSRPMSRAQTPRAVPAAAVCLRRRRMRAPRWAMPSAVISKGGP